ncbi:MAG TPA: tryptophan 2,3-dioxygenase family protein [Saprospiraceae bacterium]|nr:tryptophan 2,3-dioxygenase family protein [Saprospiraceae bacterium]
MIPDKKYASIHYNDYLQIDKIISSQGLRSVELGVKAHDEMLFIITHQVYELWFKQIIHELSSISEDFNDDVVNEKNIGIAVGRLHRITEIFKLLIQQISILETMTPLDFLDFRNFLFPASGFQSFQFRQLEVMLGLKRNQRITYNNKAYEKEFTTFQQEKINELEAGNSLFQLIENWLERTPFLEFGSFNFIEEYRKAVLRMLEKENVAIKNSIILDDQSKEMRIKMLGDTHNYFAIVMDQNNHEKLLSEGSVRLSYRATVAALFINLYRDEPILHLPFQLIAKLIEMDDLLAQWRSRHAQMVMRMLGKKVGTGGSSGHEYLAKTAQSHFIFNDFHNVSTLLIPRSELPQLPDDFRRNLGFYFSFK